MYAIQKNEVVKIEIIKQSKRGTAFWTTKEGQTKKVLIGENNIFDTEDEAKRELNERLQRKLDKERRIKEQVEKETEEIKKVVEKIYMDFGTEIPRLIWSQWDKEEAWEVYHELRRMKGKKV